MCGRRCHNFREFKFWVPLYIWIVRKRADQAYKAYRIRYNEELTEARAKLEAHVGKRQSSISVTAVLEADISLLVRSQVSHFDFLEDIVGYHIIKVGSYAGRRICARVLTRLCPIAQAYNSLCGPAREVLSSPQQWQLAGWHSRSRAGHARTRSSAAKARRITMRAAAPRRPQAGSACARASGRSSPIALHRRGRLRACAGRTALAGTCRMRRTTSATTRSAISRMKTPSPTPRATLGRSAAMRACAEHRPRCTARTASTRRALATSTFAKTAGTGGTGSSQ